MPEYRLAVDPVHMPSEIPTDQSGRYRFQVVDQLAQLNRRVRLKQQVDMIGFAVELDQFTMPFLQCLLKDLAQPSEHLFRNRLATIFCH